MSDDEQKKLCWECGAEVDFTAEECPFCGAQFEIASSSSSPSINDQPQQESFAAGNQQEDPYEPIFESSYSDGELPFGSNKSSDESSYSAKSSSDSSEDLAGETTQNMYLDADEEDLFDLSSHQAPTESSLFSDPIPKDDHRDDEAPKKGHLFSLCLIIPGFSLLLFGLGMVLFSENGQLTLRWDASYGLFVFTISALFIYLGARAFRRM